MKTDAQLKQDILAELDWDPVVQATDVGVIVHEGVVTLTGHLASHAEKHAIERAVQRVSGVRALAIELEVRPGPSFARDDADIATAAEHALEWSVLVPNGCVQAIVENGHVTLNGEVEWDYQRRAAERALCDLHGVVGISNRIKVEPNVRVSTGEVEKSIHDALERQADRAARHVQVSVDGQRVTLRGTVHSLAERKAAQGAAASAAGVAAVVNELTVD
jgi:osmotically-inducible protein OsmY